MNKYYLGSTAGEYIFILSDKSFKKEEEKEEYIIIDASPKSIIKTIFRKVNVRIKMRVIK